tara:strand:+ start:54 stop:260 length:207 start_codon:yes stop_codon:yes gene_type:complete
MAQTYIKGADAPDELTFPTNVTIDHVSNDYTGFTQDSIVFTGSGVQGGLWGEQHGDSPFTYYSEEFDR